MPKKISDLKLEPNKKKIDLRGPKSADFFVKEFKRLKKNKYNLYKQKTPITEVKDLSGGKKANYIYIKGKQFTPPKFLGNLLKIAGIGFLIILIINTVNVYHAGKKLEENISAEAAEGYSFLIDAGKSATKVQFDSALEIFEKALENFSDAKEKLWFVSTDKSFYANDNNVTHAASALLTGGKYFALSGGYFLEAMEEFNKIPLYFVAKNNNPEAKVSITDALKIGLEKTDLAISQVSLASEQMATINVDSLPSEISLRVKFAQEKVAETSELLNTTAQHFPALLKLLGDRYPHRYLILFQNNNEIRPTGGFIGSYAIMDLNEGFISGLETNDVYDLDGYYGGIIEPPDELKAFTGNWRFRDSNYSPDFPTSAAKARWFLQKEGGPTVDTVIAINQGLLQDLLEVTGPVQVGGFGKLNSENYNLLLSYIIEGKIWGAEDPKHILKVFVPAFKDAILKEANIGKVGSKIFKAIQQKHVMLYSSDPEIQALFDAFGISGRVSFVSENEDYLSVINTAYGGTKSEPFIEEKITHDTYIDENGSVINTVTVSRSHLWTDDIYFRWRRILKSYGFEDMPDSLIDLLGRGANKVSVRIYVPAGSILLTSNGSDVITEYDKDLKKTYFRTKMEVSAGETAEFTLKYKLPFILDFNSTPATYRLFIDKQPGSRGSLFTKTISADDQLYNLSAFPSESRIDQNGQIIYATNLVYDRYFAGVWGK